MAKSVKKSLQFFCYDSILLKSGAKWKKNEQSGVEVERMYGKYKHTIDAKGRLFVPSKLRDELGSAFYIAKAPDPCVTIFTEEGWQRLLDRCNELPTSRARALRIFLANVVKCEPDKQGRFLLPETMREYAGIEQEVVFLGQAGRAEIWAADRYDEEEKKFLTPEAIATVMEELGL